MESIVIASSPFVNTRGGRGNLNPYVIASPPFVNTRGGRGNLNPYVIASNPCAKQSQPLIAVIMFVKSPTSIHRRWT